MLQLCALSHPTSPYLRSWAISEAGNSESGRAGTAPEGLLHAVTLTVHLLAEPMDVGVSGELLEVQQAKICPKSEDPVAGFSLCWNQSGWCQKLKTESWSHETILVPALLVVGWVWIVSLLLLLSNFGKLALLTCQRRKQMELFPETNPSNCGEMSNVVQ